MNKTPARKKAKGSSVKEAQQKNTAEFLKVLRSTKLAETPEDKAKASAEKGQALLQRLMPELPSTASLIQEGEVRYVPHLDRHMLVIKVWDDAGDQGEERSFLCAPISQFSIPGTAQELAVGNGVVLQIFLVATLRESILKRYTLPAKQLCGKAACRDAFKAFCGFGTIPQSLAHRTGEPVKNPAIAEYFKHEMAMYSLINYVDLEDVCV